MDNQQQTYGLPVPAISWMANADFYFLDQDDQVRTLEHAIMAVRAWMAEHRDRADSMSSELAFDEFHRIFTDWEDHIEPLVPMYLDTLALVGHVPYDDNMKLPKGAPADFIRAASDWETSFGVTIQDTYDKLRNEALFQEHLLFMELGKERAGKE